LADLGELRLALGACVALERLLRGGGSLDLQRYGERGDQRSRLFALRLQAAGGGDSRGRHHGAEEVLLVDARELGCGRLEDGILRADGQALHLVVPSGADAARRRVAVGSEEASLRLFCVRSREDRELAGDSL